MRLNLSEKAFWTLDVSLTESYEITLVHLSVHVSVCLSVLLSDRPSVTKFSQDWIISFSEIVQDDNWPLYLVTDEAKFL